MKKPDSRDNTRINDQITAPQLRVTGSDGEALGVLSLSDALKRAESEDLDLVEVSPNAEPPVARIVDYGKYLYQKEKKIRESRKNQKIVELKEVKFGPYIDIHDFDYRVRHIKDFLSKGDKVKVSIRFRGREMAHTDMGFDIIKRILENVDGAVVEKPAKLEGRQIFMVMSPSKGKPPTEK